MKNVMVKDFLKELWLTRTRFISILLIVALGTGFFAGVAATGVDMLENMDSYFVESNFMDAQLMSTLGFSENDTLALEKITSVEKATLSYQADFIVESKDSEFVVRTHSYPENEVKDRVNSFKLVSGRMPKNAGECLLEDSGGMPKGSMQLGDSFVLSTGTDTNITDVIAGKVYTVVGTIVSPLYISITRGNTTIGKGVIDLYMYLPESEFTLKAYTTMYVKYKKDSRLSTDSEEYANIESRVMNAVNAAEEIRSVQRLNEVLEGPRAEIIDAKNQLEKEEKTGEKLLQDALVKLWEARSILETNEEAYLVAIDEYSNLLASGGAMLSDSEVMLAQGEMLYAEGLREYLEHKEEFDKKSKEAADGFAEAEYYMRMLQVNIDFCNGRIQALKNSIASLELNLEEMTGGGTIPPTSSGQPVINPPSGDSDSSGDSTSGDSSASSATDSSSSGSADSSTYSGAAESIGAGAKQLEKYVAGMPQQEFFFAVGILPSNIAVGGFFGQKIAATGNRDTVGIEQNILTKNAPSLFTGVSVGAAYGNMGDRATPEYEEVLQEIETQRIDLVQIEQTLGNNQASYDSIYSVYSASKQELAYAQESLLVGAELLELNRSALDNGYEQLTQGKAALETGRVEGEKALESAREELDNAWEEVAEGEAEYAESLAEFNSEIAKAKADIFSAEEEIEKVKPAEWIVTSRQDMGDVSGFIDNAARIQNISKVFPLFFMLIAALICLTTMTRMVEDQRVQIGTLKAMGYSRFAIAMKFIVYALLASLFGSVAGMAVGFVVFPKIIFSAYTVFLYQMPDIATPFRWEYAIPTTAVSVTAIIVVTLLTCLSALKATPASLLRPASPKSGKRIWLENIGFVWNRISFSWKVTLRNIFRYKKRMLMTIVGVAGCTSLMLAGFGLKDAIIGITDRQFSEIYTYEMSVIVDTELATTAGLEQEILQQEGVEDLVFVLRDSANASLGKGTAYSADVFAYENAEDLSGFISLKDYKTGQGIRVGDDGVIITQKLAKLLGLSPGDKMQLDCKGNIAKVTVLAIAENYILHSIYMTNDLYEQAFGATAPPNYALLNTAEGFANETALSEKINNIAGVTTVVSLSSMSGSMDDQMAALDIVVLVLIASSAVLAFVVMYNLTNINIMERTREIATIKVLGFFQNETSNYVYRENIILTLIGALFGLLLGVLLTSFVVGSAEIDQVMFVREIKPLSFIYSFVITVVFALIVRIPVNIKLKKIDMIEALKSVD